MAKEKDPASWPSNTYYQYLKSTSSSGLRGHIRKYHYKLHTTLAPQYGWKPLESQSRSQAVSGAKALQVKQPDEFTMEKFHTCLLNFIVVDDQVEHLLSFYIYHTYISLFRTASL